MTTAEAALVDAVDAWLAAQSEHRAFVAARKPDHPLTFAELFARRPINDAEHERMYAAANQLYEAFREYSAPNGSFRADRIPYVFLCEEGAQYVVVTSHEARTAAVVTTGILRKEEAHHEHR